MYGLRSVSEHKTKIKGYKTILQKKIFNIFVFTIHAAHHLYDCVCVLTFIHTYNRFPACVKAGFAMLV